MKNRIPFAAFTFAFTVAGACLGHAINEPVSLSLAVFVIASIGGIAAAMSGDNL